MEVNKEEKIKRSKVAKNSRRKGHNLERRVTKAFRDLGYEFAKTSRQASKLLDDSKVDIAFVPYSMQTKKGYVRGLNYTKIFLDMKEAINKNFPPGELVHNYPPIILHDKGIKSEEKLVIMEESSFWKLVEKNKDKI